MHVCSHIKTEDVKVKFNEIEHVPTAEEYTETEKQLVSL